MPVGIGASADGGASTMSFVVRSGERNVTPQSRSRLLSIDNSIAAPQFAARALGGLRANSSIRL